MTRPLLLLSGGDGCCSFSLLISPFALESLKRLLYLRCADMDGRRVCPHGMFDGDARAHRLARRIVVRVVAVVVIILRLCSGVVQDYAVDVRAYRYESLLDSQHSRARATASANNQDNAVNEC